MFSPIKKERKREKEREKERKGKREVMVVIINWMGESFHNVHLYQIIMLYTLNILQFYLPIMLKKTPTIPKHNKIKLLKNSDEGNILKAPRRDFPGGAVVKNPPANAGDTGSRSGKIPHAVEQLSLCATTTEPVCHNY